MAEYSKRTEMIGAFTMIGVLAAVVIGIVVYIYRYNNKRPNITTSIQNNAAFLASAPTFNIDIDSLTGPNVPIPVNPKIVLAYTFPPYKDSPRRCEVVSPRLLGAVGEFGGLSDAIVAPHPDEVNVILLIQRGGE